MILTRLEQSRDQQGSCGHFLGLIFLLWVVSSSGLIQAAEAPLLNVKIVDVNGKALPDAVLELPASTAAAGAHGAVNMHPVSMDQVNVQFSPRVLLITQGQRVFFPNSDNIRHHVYSFSAAKTFEIKLYAENPGEPIVFDSPGIVVLGCNIHDSMIGYIYVADSGQAAKSDDNGLLTIETAADVQTVSVWHPSFADTGQSRLSLKLEELPVESAGNRQKTVLIRLPVASEDDSESAESQGDKFLDFELP